MTSAIGPRVVGALHGAARYSVQLVLEMHAISNALSGKNLRAAPPHQAGLEPVSPGESPLVLGLPEHQIGQLGGRYDPAIRPRDGVGPAHSGRDQGPFGGELEDPNGEGDDEADARDAASTRVVVGTESNHRPGIGQTLNRGELAD